MSLETQVQALVNQTQQLDSTMQGELLDVNTDIALLRARVTDLEIRMGMPDDDSPTTIPGGGGGSTTNPDTGIGNDVIQIDTENDLLWVWNPTTGEWVSVPFTEIAPPVELNVQAIIDQANNSIDAGIQLRIDELAASIQASVLATQQTQIDGLVSQVTTMGTTVEGHTAAIQQEATTRADADTAIASQVDDLVAQVDANHQAFIAFQTAVAADPNGAAAQVLQQMQSQIDSNTAAIQTEANTRATADSSTATQVNTLLTSVGAAQTAIQQEVTARSTADSALTTSVSSLASRMGNAEGAIQTLQTVTSGLNSSIVEQVNTLTSSVDGMSATVQDISSAINGIEAKRSLVISAGGKVTGIELLGGGSVGSQIKFQTPNFIMYDPTTGAESVPFSVIGGTTYIKSAAIQNASINKLKIGNEEISILRSVNRTDIINGAFTDGLSPTESVIEANAVSAISLSVTLPEAASVMVLLSMQHTYYGWNPTDANYLGPLATAFFVYADGTKIFSRAIQAINDTPTFVAAVPLTAGAHTITVKWSGTYHNSTAKATLGNRSLAAFVPMR